MLFHLDIYFSFRRVADTSCVRSVESYHDSVDELNAHYERDHPTGSATEKNFQCKLCDKSFTRCDSMYKHQRKVHGRVLYKSDNQPELIQPNEEGRFPCDFCDKTFSERFSVYLHQRTVHGYESEKKRKRKQGTFACDICGKMLSDRSNVTRHMKTVHKHTIPVI